MSLTENQLKAKQRVENAGGVFLSPSEYKEKMMGKKKTTYSKRSVKVNPQQVAAYATKKAYKKDFKEISPDTDRLIDQVLNPEDAVDVIRWPNTYGLSSIYKCKTVLNANFSADSRSMVAVSPNLRDSIFATWGAETQHKIAAPSPAPDVPFCVQKVSLRVGDDSVFMANPIIFPSGQALCPLPNASVKQLIYPFGAEVDGTHNTGDLMLFKYIFPQAVGSQVAVGVNLFDSSMNIIYNKAYPISFDSQVGSFSAIAQIDPDEVDFTDIAYMSSWFTARNLPYKGHVIMSIPSSYSGSTPTTYPFTIVLPNHAQHVGVYDIKDAGLIDDSASQAFVLAQSLLLTAEMSDINNGGQLAIARIPANQAIGIDGISNSSSISSNNWYEWISSLSNHNYDGPVKNGGYAWYLPEDETGYFYRDIDNYFSKELPYIAAEFTCVQGLAESSVVRIKVSTVIQFTTSSSVYEQRPSCHISEMDFMHHILSIVPAAYSNDGHLGGLKKYLKSAGGKVKVLLKDPNTYATAAKIMATLGPLLL